MARENVHDPLLKAYRNTQKDDPKDRVEVEIGDSKDSSEFHPQMKMKRWDNEANVSFRLTHDFIPGNVSYSEENGVIEWKKKQGQNEWVARFYEDWGTPEGAYKFVELVLPAKPPTNQISFTTQSKDVDFFYQPALTQQEIDDGAERPENVVGSYAIYSKSSGGVNRADGKDYKVGKVGHLYRAKLIDANGDEIWADYNTDLNDTGILTITVDQTWLDNAVYPVVVDPTFGYTSIGATELTLARHRDTALYNETSRSGTTFNLPEDGTLDSISVYSHAQPSTADQNVDFYVALNRENSAGSDSHDEVVLIEDLNHSTPQSPSWHTFNASSESIVADDYVINVCANPEDISGAGSNTWSIRRRADFGATGNNTYTENKTGSSTYSNSKEDPWGSGAEVTTYTVSIYATYTASGGGETVATGSMSTNSKFWGT